MLELEILMPPKTTTPKIQHRAGELRQNQTEAEAKLWSRLRAHRMAGVQFRRQHAIGNYIVDFPWYRPPGRCVRLVENWSSNWMAVNIWIKLSMIRKERSFWKPKGTVSCGSGIMML